MMSANAIASPVNDNGMTSRQTYASEPSANDSTINAVGMLGGANTNHSGLTTKSVAAASTASVHAMRRDKSPTTPAMASATYSRSSMGSVQSEPLAEPGNGLSTY